MSEEDCILTCGLVTGQIGFQVEMGALDGWLAGSKETSGSYVQVNIPPFTYSRQTLTEIPMKSDYIM